MSKKFGTFPSFPIKFTRPLRIGDRFNLLCSRNEEESSTLDDQPPQNTIRFIEFAADITVLQVSNIGLPIAESITIRRCSLRINDSVIPSPLPDSVLELKPNDAGAQELTLVGGDLDPDAAKLLKSILPNTKEAQFDPDLTLGSNDPKTITDQWPINKQQFAKNLSIYNPNIDVADIDGTVRFDQTTQENDQILLHLSAKIAVNNFLPPQPSVEIVAASMSSAATFKLPVDPALLLRRESNSVQTLIEIIIATPNGPQKATRSALTKTNFAYTRIF